MIADDLHRHIDPGKSGAFAVIEISDMVISYAVPWDAKKFVDEMKITNPSKSVACVEHVSARPGQGVTSMFTFGENFGFIQGVLTAYAIPFELVRPQKWKKEFSITRDKNTSIEVCKRLFPDVCLKRTEKCKKDDDGLAESLLLAEYARRKFGR